MTTKHSMTKGVVEFFLGPMFSGKTTAVRRALERAQFGNLNCVFVKHATDVRYGADEAIRTHAQLETSTAPHTDTKGGVRVVVASRLLEVVLEESEIIVGIDEGQFFPDLRDFIAKCMQAGVNVYVAALDGDFRRAAFPAISKAAPLATRVTKLSAVCTSCATAGRFVVDAHYTTRTIDDEDVVVVGGSEMYMATCNACYLQLAAEPLR
jgi:thymidine kinase